MNSKPQLLKKNENLLAVLNSFSHRDRRKIVLATFLQIFLTIFDLVGIAIFGVIGTLSITGIQSKESGSTVQTVIQMLQLQNFSFQKQVAILGILGAGILILKTFISAYISKKILNFLSTRSAMLTKSLLRQVVVENSSKLNSLSNQETIYATTNGVQNLTTGVISSSSNIVVDFSLLLILSTGLLLINPLLAATTILVFGLVGFSLNMSMKKRAFKSGSKEMTFGVESNLRIWEILNSFREIRLRNTTSLYIDEIVNLRLLVSRAIAQRIFMPYISKYVIEISMIAGAVLISGIQFYFFNATGAISSLTLFIAASTRITPAILRLQQGITTIRNFLASSSLTVNLIKSLPEFEEEPLNSVPVLEDETFIPELNFVNVNFKFSDESEFFIKNLEITIMPGEKIAIVGPSGSGKTTLADLMLGVLRPESGSVKISGLDPLIAAKIWPGKIAYVPQSTFIATRSFRDNVLLGIEASDEEVVRILDFVELGHFVQNLPQGLETIIGENGLKLSGGQRQRIGIARALITSPAFLVMDEATSSLDAQTENLITEKIFLFESKITLITIAHRLSTVKNADRVLYMSNGRIEAEGTFGQVRARVPDFDTQANLMGL